jgi:hypothetical protein
MLESQKKAIEELKKKWYTVDEAINELEANGRTISKSAFYREMEKVDLNKEVGFVGKPEIKEERIDGKGRPRKLYNHAAVEALRTFTLSDTFKKVQEEPIDFFVNDDWREDISKFLSKYLEENYLNDSIDGFAIKDIVDETLEIVNKAVIERYYSLAGQNKFLVDRNKKLEDTKEYYIAVSRGIEERANELNGIADFIKKDIKASSNMLENKEIYNLNNMISVNRKLDKVLEVLNELNERKDLN